MGILTRVSGYGNTDEVEYFKEILTRVSSYGNTDEGE